MPSAPPTQTQISATSSEAEGGHSETLSLASQPQLPQAQMHYSFGRPAVPWTELEENILKTLVERYGNHWGLIHELFKSDRRIKSSGECERGLWELVER